MCPDVSHFARRHVDDRLNVADDRECVDCGYLLRGLKVGGRCPECGASIEPPLGAEHPLSRMPWRVLRVFLAGSALASACIVLTVAALWAAFFGFIPWWLVSPAMPIAAVLWVAAMWMFTPAFSFPEAQKRGFSRRSRLRRAARWGQVGWIVAAVAFAVNNTLQTPAAVNDVLSMLTVIGVMIGLIGTILLAILMQNLSEWTRDDAAGSMFNWYMWCAPAALILLWLARPFPMMQILAMGASLVSAGLFPAGILLLSKSIALSWQHHVEDEVRDQRRSERAQREAKRVDRRLEAVRPIPQHRQPPVAPKGSAEGDSQN